MYCCEVRETPVLIIVFKVIRRVKALDPLFTF
jgi:hypothetical protein